MIAEWLLAEYGIGSFRRLMDEWTLEQAYLAAANMIERKIKMFGGGGDGTTGESPASGNGTGQVPIEQMISMINSEM